MTLPFGFWIRGTCTERRELIDWHRAFEAHAALDGRVDANRAAYLSLFTFGEAFRDHLQAVGSTKGFAGETHAPWLWFDVDETELATALESTRRLVIGAADILQTSENAILVFFSGSKGFHVGIPTALWEPSPGVLFHRACRVLAERIAATCKVRIDAGIYDRVRAFRAPNSRHPKTGLHKIAIGPERVMRFGVDAIRELAKTPFAFDIPDAPGRSSAVETLWRECVESADREFEAATRRRDSNGGEATLNRATLEFIRDGAGQGDRHRLLFSAAANLAEFDCPPGLAHALLTPAARDSGLAPSEIRRQIECGLARKAGAA